MRLNMVLSRHSSILSNSMFDVTMKGKIIINYTPEGEYDLVNKEYVDSIINNLDLSLIETTLTQVNFPTVTGDFIKYEPKDQPISKHGYNLRERSGVKRDKSNYTTVDGKGLVTKSEATAPSSELPDLSFDIIDKDSFPKSIEELGIKDAIRIKSNGKSVAGFKYPNHGKSDDEPVTVKEADIFFSPKMKYDVGDIVLALPDQVSDNSDFIELDGSLLKKKDNPELYDIIGDSFGMVLTKLNGIPWKYFGIGVFEPIQPIEDPVPLDGGIIGTLGAFTSIVTKNKVYVIGGFRGDYDKLSNEVYCSNIIDDELGPWVRVGDLPDKRAFSTAIIVSNRVFLYGGTNNARSQNAVPILYCDLDDDGNLTEWMIDDVSPDRLMLCPTILIHRNRIYVTSGFNFVIDETGRFNRVPTFHVAWSNLTEKLTSHNWIEYRDEGYSAMCADPVQFGNGERLLGKAPTTVHDDVTNINFYSNNLSSEITLLKQESFSQQKRTEITSSRSYCNRSTSVGGNDIRGSGYVTLWNTGKVHTELGPYKFGSIRVWQSFGGALRAGDYKTWSSSPHIREWFDLVCIKGKVYVLGGISADSSVSSEKTYNQPTLVFSFYKNGKNDYTEDYSDIEIDPLNFNIPLVDPALVGETFYTYYIKAK